MLVRLFRQLFNLCPICGGDLVKVGHDWLNGDTYKCKTCGAKWKATR